MAEIVIIGGTSGIGRELAKTCALAGADVVIAGRDLERATLCAAELSAQLGPGAGRIRGLVADLSQPATLEHALASVDAVEHLVLAAIERDQNTLANFNIDAAIGMATVKLVGYAVATATLKDRFVARGSVLLFGGMAKDRPYPGSTTVTSVNAGVIGLAHTMMHELKPLRVNTIHPGVVGDSPYWAHNEAALEFGRRTALTGELPRMQDIVDGCQFLMRNATANGVHLSLDGGRP